MADLTVTVKPSGGNYTCLNDALSGETLDLVTNTRLLTIECYNMEDTTTWTTGTGYTTSDAYYILIVGVDNHLGVWSTGAYRYTGNAVPIGYIREAYTRVVNIQGASGTLTATGQVVCYIAANDVLLSRCIFKGSSTAAYAQNVVYRYSGTGNSYMVNCLVIAVGGTEICNALRQNSGTWYVYNCTLKNAAAGTCAGLRVATVGNVCYAKNVLSKAAIGFVSNGTLTCTNCASSDLTADDFGGSDNRVEQSFGFKDEANDDYHLTPADTGALRYGLNLYNDAAFPFTSDIDSESRGGAGYVWDIGADGYPFKGIPPAFLINHHAPFLVR